MYFRKLSVFFVGLILLFAPVKSVSAQPLTVVSPQDAAIVDTTTPDLITTSEELNIFYSWDAGLEIPGCRSCTSYNTTYGEYEHEYDGSTGVNGEPLNNLVGLWHANEGNGFTLYDDSGKGNDGLLNWNADVEIATFHYDEPYTHFSDLCYLNSGKLADDPSDDEFIYVYTKYSGYKSNDTYTSQIIAVEITRNGCNPSDPTECPPKGSTVYDKDSDPPIFYWNLSNVVGNGAGRGREMILDPSCYVFNGTVYVAATHQTPGYAKLQHIMLYEAKDANNFSAGWIKDATTYNQQEDGQSFFAVDLFEFDNRLMGVGTYGEERAIDGAGTTPSETNLRVYDFKNFIWSSGYEDISHYISSPDITKIDDTYYIAYYQAPPVTGVFPGERFNADVMLVTTTDFVDFYPQVDGNTVPICVSGDCPNTTDTTIENKWPAISKLPDGRLMIAYASKVYDPLDPNGQLDLRQRK